MYHHIMSMGKKLTITEFVTRAHEIHDYQYSYDKTILTRAHDKIMITCKRHGDFAQSANSHLSGSGCPVCARDRVARMKTKTTEQFVNQAKIVHGDTYIYDNTVYIGVDDKVTITCKIHGDFEQTANDHLHGAICKQCSNDKRRVSTEEFIRRARIVHGDTYSYDKCDTVQQKGKVIITCRVHGDFAQFYSSHVRGAGCIKCSNTRISKIANEWLDSLGIDDHCREVSLKEFSRRQVDAFVSETNTVYQFHGDYWHGNAEVYESSFVNAHNGKTMGELYRATLEWDQQIRDLGYNLVVMWESDWVRIRKQSVDINQLI